MRADELKRVEELILKRHKGRLKKHERVTVGHEDTGTIETLTLDVQREADVFRFQAQLTKAEVRPQSASTDLLLDFLDGVLDEWLESGREAYPPLDYTGYEFEGVTILLRGGLERPGLEAEADRLLGDG